MIDTTVALIWRTLLASVESGEREKLLDTLSPELLSFLEEIPPPSPRFFEEMGTPGLDLEAVDISQVDPSWFAPFLRTLAERDIRFFLSCLSLSQQQSLQKSLLFSNSLPHLTSLSKAYLRNLLAKTLHEPSLLPVICLPETPLNALLTLSPLELVSLIELLSMHDLSIEIRQIIETKKLKMIHSHLTHAQENFLKTLFSKKEAVSFKKMGLTTLKDGGDGLKALLLQRGINRMAKALFGAHPSLIWHITHRFEIEKGKLLLSLCTPLDHPKAILLLTEQILELIPLVQHPNPRKES